MVEQNKKKKKKDTRKNIKVREETHKNLLKYCKKNNYKVYDVVEKIIDYYLKGKV